MDGTLQAPRKDSTISKMFSENSIFKQTGNVWLEAEEWATAALKEQSNMLRSACAWNRGSGSCTASCCLTALARGLEQVSADQCWHISFLCPLLGESDRLLVNSRMEPSWACKCWCLCWQNCWDNDCHLLSFVCHRPLSSYGFSEVKFGVCELGVCVPGSKGGAAERLDCHLG